MSKIKPHDPTKDIAGAGPFDVVKVYEIASGSGTMTTPIPLYRGHKQQIDLFANDKVMPDRFVYAVLCMSLGSVVSSVTTKREWDGLLGAIRYAIENVPDSKWGTNDKVHQWIKSGA